MLGVLLHTVKWLSSFGQGLGGYTASHGVSEGPKEMTWVKPCFLAVGLALRMATSQAALAYGGKVPASPARERRPLHKRQHLGNRLQLARGLPGCHSRRVSSPHP